MTDEPAAIQAKIDARSIPVPECGCWIWLGGLGWGHYGKMTINQKSVGAHCASWLVYRGEIPANMQVLHKCDTPLCVNPDHLFLGTCLDNMRDKVGKARQAKGDSHGIRLNRHLVRGENNGRSKLDESTVRFIRMSGRTNADLGRRLGVSANLISQIRHKKVWRHVNG